MSDFEVKDTGNRRVFDTGAQRDRSEDKPRYGLIPPLPKRRLAMLYTRGAYKYDDWNWAKGMPFSEFIESLERHLEAYKLGEADEDHLAAICFNAMAIMHFEEMGITELDDRQTIVPKEIRDRLFSYQDPNSPKAK